MINLVPTPKKYQEYGNEICSLDYSIYSEVKEWEVFCHTLGDSFYSLYEKRAEFARGGIELVKEEGLKAGSYTIDCEEAIKVRASDDEGILYGLASVLQLTDLLDEKLQMPKVHIEDYPDKEYRALMVDLGRQWHPFPKLLKYIDLCFLYKIKYLHLHFVDTKLYTLPSKAFPKLALPHKSYTYEQIAELNAYAKARGIVLIPEYECPGHATIMRKNYPDIFGDQFESGYESDLYDDYGKKISAEKLMCAGSEACFEANKILLKEISDMFPDAPYLHIGGDEAVIKLWNHCKTCKKYMEEHNISDVYELYSEFVGRIAEYVFSLGKTPMVWEGFPEKGTGRIPKDTIVFAWQSLFHMPEKLVEEGFRVINASVQPLYVVPKWKYRYSISDILNWNVYNWQNWLPESEAYLNPITLPPTDRVIGSMLCAWEHTFERMVPYVMENLAAMSERTWTVRRVCTDDDFFQKLQKLIMKAERIIQDK